MLANEDGLDARTFAMRFRDADHSSGAMFRWWLPGAAVDHDELVAELDTIAAAGYRGVEVADVRMSVRYPMDPQRHGHGTEAWAAVLKTILEAAVERDLQVDLYVGAHWPIAVPGIDADSEASSKELCYGVEVLGVGESFEGPVPVPAPRNYESRSLRNGVLNTETKASTPVYITVSALRCRSGDTSARPLEVDLGSQVDLSSLVVDGRLRWTPPSSGSWVVVGYWYRGTGQRNDAPMGSTAYLHSDPEPRAVDHWSAAGARACTDFLDAQLGSGGRELLARTGGALFLCSLEIEHAQAWTPAFLEEFQERRGYSLLPYLAVLAHDPTPSSYFIFQTPKPAFVFSGHDLEAAARVRHDVDQTLSDLFLERHYGPLAEWTHGFGARLRIQPYHEPIDIGGAAAFADIVDGESLSGGTSDDWRVIAAGSDLAGNQIISDELLPGGFEISQYHAAARSAGGLPAGAPLRGSYRTTPQMLIRQANAEYAAGANRMILAGFPYASWPESADGSIMDNTEAWPGFHAFPVSIPEPFGPRQATWSMERDTSAYLTRVQQVLQIGHRRTDIAIYNDELDSGSDRADIAAGQFEPASRYPDFGLRDSGYTYGFVTPGSLMLPAATVSTSARLAEDGPAFKALILVDQPKMLLNDVERLQRFAHAGLPVIVVGEPPSAIPGYAVTEAVAAAADTALQQAIQVLLAEENVHQVRTSEEVPTMLAALGVHPDVLVADGAVQSVHRWNGQVDLYFLHNFGDTPFNGHVSLAARDAGCRPSSLDVWSGSINPIADYVADGERVTVGVRLVPGEAKIVAVGPCGVWGESISDLHVTETTADSVGYADECIVVRTGTAGIHRTTLSTGQRLTTVVDAVPTPIPLPRWTLEIDEHRPGVNGDSSTHTDHRTWRFNEIELTSWSQIPEITDAVGVGTYSTAVIIPPTWAVVDGAYLDLGRVDDAFRIKVNGRSVVANKLDPSVDLGDCLIQGENIIEVTIATTLLNRLRISRPGEFAQYPKHDHGLLGPVTLVPYRQIPIESPTE